MVDFHEKPKPTEQNIRLWCDTPIGWESFRHVLMTHALRMQIAVSLRESYSNSWRNGEETKKEKCLLNLTQMCISFPFDWKTNLSTQNMCINFMVWTGQFVCLLFVLCVRLCKEGWPMWECYHAHTLAYRVYPYASSIQTMVVKQFGTSRNNQSRASNTPQLEANLKAIGIFFSRFMHFVPCDFQSRNEIIRRKHFCSYGSPPTSLARFFCCLHFICFYSIFLFISWPGRMHMLVNDGRVIHCQFLVPFYIIRDDLFRFHSLVFSFFHFIHLLAHSLQQHISLQCRCRNPICRKRTNSYCVCVFRMDMCGYYTMVHILGLVTSAQCRILYREYHINSNMKYVSVFSAYYSQIQICDRWQMIVADLKRKVQDYNINILKSYEIVRENENHLPNDLIS